MIRFENILTPGRSLVNVPGRSKKSVLEAIANLIGHEVPNMDSDTVFASLVAREKLGSTGFGNGLPSRTVASKAAANPSVRSFTSPPLSTSTPSTVRRSTCFSYCWSRTPPPMLTWKLLRQIASMLDRADVRERLRSAKSGEALYQVVLDVQKGH